MLLNILKVHNLRVGTRLITWRPHLTVWRHLMEPMLSWARLVSGKLTRSRVLQIAYFAKWVAKTTKFQGRRGLVLQLKTAQVMLMQSLPGSQMKANSREIGKLALSRSRDGIPRLIPVAQRRAIRQRRLTDYSSVVDVVRNVPDTSD